MDRLDEPDLDVERLRFADDFEAAEVEHLEEPLSQGVRTWGNDRDGSTVMLVGAYEALSEISDRLVELAGWGSAASKGITGGRRGYKASLFEGGIGVPFIARWPGKIKAVSFTI